MAKMADNGENRLVMAKTAAHVEINSDSCQVITYVEISERNISKTQFLLIVT